MFSLGHELEERVDGMDKICEITHSHPIRIEAGQLLQTQHRELPTSESCLLPHGVILASLHVDQSEEAEEKLLVNFNG